MSLNGISTKKISWKYLVLIIGVLVLVFLHIGFGTAINQRAGNFFFGDSPTFYNVDVAQFFFTQSAKPLWGNPEPYAYYQLSRTYFIEGELDMALELALKELEYYPEHLRTYYILGLTLGYMHREQEAIDAFGKFLEFKPYSWAARNDKAWLHFRIGDIEGGLETILPATQHFPENAWVMNTYGVLLMNVERYSEAKVALTRAKESADAMSVEDWGIAYPGNSPEIYGDGLEAMRVSIEANLKELEERLAEHVQVGADN